MGCKYLNLMVVGLLAATPTSFASTSEFIEMTNVSTMPGSEVSSIEVVDTSEPGLPGVVTIRKLHFEGTSRWDRDTGGNLFLFDLEVDAFLMANGPVGGVEARPGLLMLEYVFKDQTTAEVLGRASGYVTLGEVGDYSGASTLHGHLKLPPDEENPNGENIVIRAIGDSDFGALVNAEPGEPIVLNEDLYSGVMMTDKPGRLFENQTKLKALEAARDQKKKELNKAFKKRKKGIKAEKASGE